MTTVERIGWMSVIIVLLVAVSNVIIQPIYDKAVEQKDEINNIEFEDPSESGSLNEEIMFAMHREKVKELDGNIREDKMVTHMAYNV